MSIITITSDFGYKDFYISALKAEILSIIPTQIIVDISHEVKHFNIKEGNYMLNSVYKKFPSGSVHLFLVNAGGLKNDPDVYAFNLNEHFFICTGQSFITLFEENPTMVVKIKSSLASSFSSLHTHIKTACELVSKKDLLDLGDQIDFVKPSFSSGLLSSKDSIIGTIINIDSYGNAITNITKSEFEGALNGRKYEISFARERVTNISDTYNQVEFGDPVCLFNENNKLEIAMAFGNASRLMGLQVEHKVKITFS